MISRIIYPTQKELQEHYTYLDGHLYYMDGSQVLEYGPTSTNIYKSIFHYNMVRYCLHRIIYILVKGDISIDLDVDHKDRDTINNLEDNLRACTRSLNSCNAKPRPNSKTGVRGVYKRHGINGQYAVTVCGFYIGQWPTIDEALTARNKYIEDNVK